jgi:hypothetical protein
MAPPLTETMYLRYSTKQECKQASADLWVRLLGHPKNPGDVTEFIFPTLGCQDGGHDYLILTEPLFSEVWPKLTPQEQNFLNANMVPASNVQVQNCMASLPETGA